MYFKFNIILIISVIKIYLNQNIEINLILTENQNFENSLEIGSIISITYSLNSSNIDSIFFNENFLILKGESSTINLDCTNNIISPSTEPNKTFTINCQTLTLGNDSEYTLDIGNGSIESSNENEIITVNVLNDISIYGNRNIIITFTLGENQEYKEGLFGLQGFFVNYELNIKNKGDFFIEPGILILKGNCDNVSVSCGYFFKEIEANNSQTVLCRTRETGNCSYYNLDVITKEISTNYQQEKLKIVVNNEKNITFKLKENVVNSDNNKCVYIKLFCKNKIYFFGFYIIIILFGIF